ncbi:hypothetical protein L593_00140 [Salinarchaeum sp. Harcht-Bsk1]|nr:hypothetical protein L593_00140 [Salinarchaeum sp. Harcht-Bsk1]
MASLVSQIEELVELFTDVATSDPVSPLLVVAGAAIFAVAVGIVSVLVVGAILETMGRPFE